MLEKMDFQFNLKKWEINKTKVQSYANESISNLYQSEKKTLLTIKILLIDEYYNGKMTVLL